MLTGITIDNFKSFKNKCEFDFTPTKYTILQNKNVSDDKVLKGALFIGPNASGKTTVLEAISFLINLINGDKNGFHDVHCMFSTKVTTEVTYQFKFKGKRVEYAVTSDCTNNSLSEQLSVDNRIILTRDGKHGELKLSDNQTIIDDQLDESTSFLRTSSFNTGRFPQNPILRDLIEYVQNSVYIDGRQLSAFIGMKTNSFLEQNGADKFNVYLNSMKYDFHTEYDDSSSGEGLTLQFGNGKNTILKRNNFSLPIPFISESQGNKVFMEILASMIPIIEKPGMIVIDEFGNSLHNMLAERIVSFFMESAKNSQLFLTSHCTNLLSNSVFRPDQIYSVTFHGKEGSSRRRVSDFKPREAQNLEKMYLGGMFEGLPDYGEEI